MIERQLRVYYCFTCLPRNCFRYRIYPYCLTFNKTACAFDVDVTNSKLFSRLARPRFKGKISRIPPATSVTGVLLRGTRYKDTVHVLCGRRMSPWQRVEKRTDVTTGKKTVYVHAMMKATGARRLSAIINEARVNTEWPRHAIRNNVCVCTYVSQWYRTHKIYYNVQCYQVWYMFLIKHTHLVYCKV